MATGRKRTVEEQVRDRKIEKEVALGVERKMKRARHNKKHNLLRAKKAKAEKKQREEIVPVEASAQRKLRAQQREQLAKKAVTQESRELARRELARRDLIRFSKRFMPAYDPGWVHEDIATRLVQFMKDIEDKKSPRLMLFMPPRHGKSQLASIFFPAFLLGHHPEFEIIASSYAVSLPLGFSRKVKALIETAGYQALFPKTKLNKNSQAAEAWLTTEAGGYVAAGVGGGITGKGSHCMVATLTVHTLRGIIPIAQVRVGDEVLGYDHEEGRQVWARVKAVSAARKTSFVKVGDVRCTPDHRIWTKGRGYVPAGELRASDDLVTMRPLQPGVSAEAERTHPQQVRSCRQHEAENVLQSRVLEKRVGYVQQDDVHVWEEESPSCQHLSGVLRGWAKSITRPFDLPMLRERVQASARRVQQSHTKSWGGRKFLLLQWMQQNFQTYFVCCPAEIARSVLELPVSHYDEGHRAKVLLPQVLYRPQEGFSIRQRICRVLRGLGFKESQNSGERSTVPFVPDYDSSGSTPYRPQSGEPQLDESVDAVSSLPHVISSQIGVSAGDLQSSVRGHGEDVVDIQTGTGNFFAEGILVHNCFIIDDPVKDAQEADSETTRASTWDWWGSTAKTRLAPGGGVLCIQTRWHDDDLSGKLISQQHQQEAELGELIEDAEHRLALLTRTSDEARKTYSELEMYKAELATIDRWEVVSFPAIAMEPEFRHVDTREIKRVSEFESPELIPGGFELLRDINEPLHESRFPWHRLMNMKRSMQPRHWSALYQQNPVPDEGEYFQKSMFRSTHGVVDTKGMHVYAAWDLAIGQKQTNDFTVGVVVALDHNDIIHILDVVRFRGDSFAIVEAILDVENRYSPVLTGIEKGHLEMAIKPQMDRRVRERKLYPTFAEGKEALVPITDKILRARPLQGRMQQGMVHFPANQPWVETLQQEMLRFPGGVHDDQVDALAWVVRLLLKRTAPSAHGKVRKIKSWKDRLPGLMRGARTPMGA